MAGQRCRKVVILGSTGSIGTSALKVARQLPERMQVVGLAAGKRVHELAAQAAEFGVRAVCLGTGDKVKELRRLLPAGVQVYVGEEGLCRLAALEDADMVLVSVVGTAGLRPALQAIACGKDLALASKEVAVMAGELVMQRAAATGVRILPVDSEHNAVFQCLQAHGGQTDEVRRLILTASGGPFLRTPRKQLADVTPAQALRHPTWKMGPKITVDSATLFNKGLEMIEASRLFGIPIEQVDVLVHPQSIVHSLVEFRDGSLLAQMSCSDMCFPIQYAVTYPERCDGGLRRLRLEELSDLHFELPRTQDFPALNLARRAAATGGTCPAVYNAANEEAVRAFMQGLIPFPAIWETVEQVMNTVPVHACGEGLTAILKDDAEARQCANALMHR